MIQTNEDYVEALYDRKSPRHSWQLVLATLNYKHMNRVAEVQAQNAEIANWQEYEQRLFTFDTSITHEFPANLPRNYKEL